MLRIYTVALFASVAYAWSNSIHYYQQLPTAGACCNRALGCRNEPALTCCGAPFAQDLFGPDTSDADLVAKYGLLYVSELEVETGSGEVVSKGANVSESGNQEKKRVKACN